MFDYKQTLTQRIADAVDLTIDFATLGEYGLEHIATPPEPAGRTRRPCEADRRAGGLRPRAQEPQESFEEALFPNQCGGRRRLGEVSSHNAPSVVRAGMRCGAGAFEKQD